METYYYILINNKKVWLCGSCLSDLEKLELLEFDVIYPSDHYSCVCNNCEAVNN